MDRADLLELIRDRYRSQLEELHGLLSSPAGRNGPGRGSGWRAPALGPVPSFLDPYVDVMLGADISSYAWYEGDPDLTGDLTTVSLSGHHRLLGGRTRLARDEADAWAVAVLGPQNTAWIYRADAVSGMDWLATTAYYHLYTDSNGAPALLPCGSSLAVRCARMNSSPG